MKFFVTAALFATVLGSPLVERDVNGTESHVDVGPAFPPEHPAHLNVIFTSDTPAPVPAAKRSVEVAERSLAKRDMQIDVYQDINRAGRHEALWTASNRCYDLGNGWNDAISSIQIPPNWGCYFYENGGCGGAWISIGKTSNYVFLNCPDWGFNDKISSYLCYQ